MTEITEAVERLKTLVAETVRKEVLTGASLGYLPCRLNDVDTLLSELTRLQEEVYRLTGVSDDVRALMSLSEKDHALIRRLVERATRPIVGMHNRTAQEVFDIMCDRVRFALQAAREEAYKEGAEPVALEELLKDPNAVHLNMLRGGIAKLTPAQIGHLYRGEEAEEVIREVRRQNPPPVPQEGAGEPAKGWLYHCPDTGTEWSDNHPIESGEVPDAKDVRPSTLDALHAELMAAWEVLAERPSPPDPQARIAALEGEVNKAIRILSDHKLGEPRRVLDARDVLIIARAALNQRAGHD